MSIIHDETVCGPLCQHPSCWSSTGRLVKGKPRRLQQPLSHGSSGYGSDSDDDDEIGLPTQKVVNLLDEFGDDPYDRFPSQHAGKPAHERPSLSALKERHTTRASFPTVPAPRGSPASAPPKLSLSPQQLLPPKLGQVEVQEVFELDELNKGWQDTFMAKKYYVWVPNPDRKPRDETLDPLNTVRQQNKPPPPTVTTRDMTEDLLPRRLHNTAHTLRKLRSRSPPSRMKTPKVNRATPERFYGVYELLNLPKDVLGKILDQFNESDRSALLSILPTLEKQRQEAYHLAHAQVLKQRKMELLPDRQRDSRGVPGTSTEQVFLMDGGVVGSASTRDTPGTLSAMKTRETQTTPRLLLNSKKPLPPVPARRGLETPEGMTTRLPHVTLGLPVIPSGARHTQPFTYNKNAGYDFTIGPKDVPPPPSPCVSPPAPISPQASRLTITLPAAEPEQPQQTPQPPSTAEDKEKNQGADGSKMVTAGNKTLYISDSGPAPLHAVSPAASTNLPHAPHSTPAPLGGGGTPATPHSNNGGGSSPVKVHVPTTSGGAAETPDTPALEPIVESSGDDKAEQTRLAQASAASRRSVRFAISPAPPSNSPRSPSPPQEKQQQDTVTEEAVAAPEPAPTDSVIAEEGGLTGRSIPQEAATGTTQQAPVTVTSPEPWPKGKQEGGAEGAEEGGHASRADLHRTNSSASGSRLVHRSPNSRMSSRERHTSPAGRTPIPRVGLPGSGSLPRSLHSRDEALRALHDAPVDSPGPPPPSPEPKDLPGASSLEDIAEADSENTARTTGRKGEQRSSQGVEQNSQAVERNSQGGEQNSQGAEQNSQGVEQNSQGGEQNSQAVEQNSQGEEQNNQGGEQNCQGGEQNGQAVEQNNQGEEQNNQGGEQNSQGVEQNSQEGQQNSQGREQNSQEEEAKHEEMNNQEPVTQEKTETESSKEQANDNNITQSSEQVIQDSKQDDEKRATTQRPLTEASDNEFPAMVTPSTQLGEGLDLAEADLLQAVSQLDEFDATDDVFKEELQDEYHKLSRDGDTVNEG